MCPPAPGPRGWPRRLISSDGAGLPQSDLIASIVLQHHPTSSDIDTLLYHLVSGHFPRLLRLLGNSTSPNSRHRTTTPLSSGLSFSLGTLALFSGSYVTSRGL